MKKSIRTGSLNLPPLRIYIDDILYLCDLIKNSQSDSMLNIGEFEFEDINEIQDLREKYVRDVWIRNRETGVVFSMSGSAATILFHENDPVSVGIASKIKDRLMKRRSWSQEFMSGTYSTITILSISILLSFLIVSITKYFEIVFFKDQMWLVAISIMVFIALMTFSIKLSNIKNILIMTEEKNDGRFWSRNKDKILVGLIFMILGTIVGKLFG